jgi:hypothetical protein
LSPEAKTYSELRRQNPSQKSDFFNLPTSYNTKKIETDCC